jgi:predicted RNase H-like HicB family nuclease
MRYLVVIERGESSVGAYVPDLPGCIAVGDTEEEARKLIREAIEFHIEGLREHGEKVPAPLSSSTLVEVGAVRTI